MIGVKSIAIVTIAAITAAVAIATGLFAIDRLEQVTVPSAFAIGLFASLGAALVGFGARPGTPSRAAVVLRGGRPTLALDLRREGARELPAFAQRMLVIAVFASLGLATFSSDATARIASVPAAIGKPSRAGYCLPEPVRPDVPAPVAAPPPPPVDQAGCALVKRAYALGYAKSLGSCAPRAAPVAPATPTKPAAREVCERRELDEPFLHYTWRRVVGTLADASPIDAASSRIANLQTRVGYLRDLLADIEHSITGTPHGAHHIWITLPDPHPHGTHLLAGKERCTSTFANLPLWPAWTAQSSPSAVVEHVIGQLLFATRFGTPASCSDYTLHWGAPNATCARLFDDPVGFLAEQGALDSIRAVLDRRRRQAALRELAGALGTERRLPEPPPARSVVSVACFAVGPGKAAVSGRELALDGEIIELRIARMTSVTGTGAGPLDVYAQLAQLLAGTASPAQPHATEPFVPDNAFSLAQLEPLVPADPFTEPAVRAALDRPELAVVYPFDHHLHAFVEAFRRVYFAQRGRL